jgi:hypothetical protein
VVALGGIAGQNAPLARRFGQQRLEGTDLIVLAGNRTLLQHNAGLHLIDMQDLLLGLLSSIDLLAGAAQGFAINRQMIMLLACLHR